MLNPILKEKLDAAGEDRFAVLKIPIGVVSVSLEQAEALGWKFVGSLGLVGTDYLSSLVVFRREPK